ncbi:hypothetical protein [Jiangella sp. DSM 45060]|uniref:hypothetical protein n=1 Tax=Jiangella sp. DSM 45060 TaxID=1798224 RepID=UPI00087A95B9|nr:hypothetical protein [Jiangella sp. DSM 45060]SDT70196.1 hypothetical protein SAMN04515669_6153 [Jiangella sp. DSM 45060]
MESPFHDVTRALRRRWPGGRVAPAVTADPFETLTVQLRLSRVAGEIRRLERDQGRWARAHHLAAASRAYDDLLLDAARLAGLPVPDAPPAIRRVMIESALRHDGWSW